jgi:hypothetical protein
MFRLLLSQVSYAEAAKLSKKVGPFIECSAKTGENLRLVFQEAVRTAINKPKTKPRNCNLLWKSKKRKKYDWNQFTQIRLCANISIKIDKYILFQWWSKFTWKSPVQFCRVQLFLFNSGFWYKFKSVCMLKKWCFWKVTDVDNQVTIFELRKETLNFGIPSYFVTSTI